MSVKINENHLELIIETLSTNRYLYPTAEIEYTPSADGITITAETPSELLEVTHELCAHIPNYNTADILNCVTLSKRAEDQHEVHLPGMFVYKTQQHTEP